MNFPIYIAKRYLISKKSHNAINLISWVSVLGIAVGTMGLVIVLSVFNGFGDLVLSLYDSFDPDIKITLYEGKTFDPASIKINELKNINGVKSVTQTLEENALLKYREKQVIATIKGVDKNFTETSEVKQNIVEGEMMLEDGESNFAVVGSGIAYTLGINLEDVFSNLGVYVPKRGRDAVFTPEDAFQIMHLRPSGIFAIQQDFDTKYVIVPMRFAREMVSEDNKISSLEIAVDKNQNIASIKSQIAKLTGARFKVLDRIEQHDFLNKILKSEKWAVYIILSLILLISAFSIIGSLTMLIIDKKKDISILLSMGAGLSLIRKIFLTEGLLISLLGGISGLIFGWLVCVAQQKFKLIKLGDSDSFVIDAYPVSMQPMDFITVFIIIFCIGFTLSWYASYKLITDDKGFKV